MCSRGFPLTATGNLRFAAKHRVVILSGLLTRWRTPERSHCFACLVNTIDIASQSWDERTSAASPSTCDTESMFRQLFEGSADAILLFDPAREVFVDCNQAAVEMMRANDKQ